MNLNYDKIRARHEHGGNSWTSYSDLFLVLSITFLLLYVVASIRASMFTLAQQSQLAQAAQEAADMKRQIKAYESVRDDYLKDGASEEEVKMYQQLMSKLDLLQGAASDERRDAFAKAREAGEKERELNRYQKMVKDIISANLVSQSRVQKRDQIIGQRTQEIDQLNRNVIEKERTIAENSQQIEQIQDKLEKQIQEVQWANRSKKRSKEKLEQEIAGLRNASAKQIAALQNETSRAVSELEATKSQLENKNREAERLLTTLNDKQAKYQATIGELQGQHERALEQERKKYEGAVAQARLSAEEKAAQARAYQAAVEAQKQAYAQKMAGLQGELANTKNSIKDIEGKYQSSIGQLQQTNKALESSLQASMERLNAQRKVAQHIQEGFRRAGLNAEVDGKTGDVTVSFGDEYFDSGRADLKPGMRSRLQQLMPVYAKGLFEDPKIAKKISNVEIVGFASPTYQGKYVDPASLSEGDRQAVNFNMDLSYQRAKSIFEHVFDPHKMSFEHQKQLLPLVKVTGRSYLASESLQNSRTPSATDMSIAEYCKKFDCRKSQRVIIRFNLREE